MKANSLKIGVITYWWSKENYGQILQMYALQEYLNQLGHNAYLIKYNPNTDVTLMEKRNILYNLKKIFNPKAVNRFVKQRIDNWKKDEERIKHPRFFNEFLTENIKATNKIYNSIDELRKDPPEAAVYITGSDVVWRQFRPAYYLDFGSTDTKRISYAPSFGRETISEEESAKIEPLLKKFNLVTVRESQGVDICLKAGRIDAKFVLDPTFLLPKEHYFKKAKNFNDYGKYCFLYLLGSETKFSRETINKVAQSKEIDVIYATCDRFDNYTKVYPTIEEWLGYYKSADSIITNSYHGCIYSIIFNKNFIFLPLEGEHSKLNVRVTSLLTEFNLMSRICNNNLKELFEINIDYEAVNKLLQNRINDIKSMLTNELNSK